MTIAQSHCANWHVIFLLRLWSLTLTKRKKKNEHSAVKIMNTDILRRKALGLNLKGNRNRRYADVLRTEYIKACALSLTLVSAIITLISYIL